MARGDREGRQRKIVEIDKDHPANSKALLERPAALDAAAQLLYDTLCKEPRLRRWTQQSEERRLLPGLRRLLAKAFAGGEWPVQPENLDLLQGRLPHLVDALEEAASRPAPLGEDVLGSAVEQLISRGDARVDAFLECVRGAHEPHFVWEPSEEPPLDDVPEPHSEALAVDGPDGGEELDSSDGEEGAEEEDDRSSEGSGQEDDIMPIDVHNFEFLKLQDDVIKDVKASWLRFVDAAGSEEAAGHALYNAIIENVLSLRNLFTTPRAIQGPRFATAIGGLVDVLDSPEELKVLVEALGFRHLSIDVTIPRVEIIRGAIVDILEVELGHMFSYNAQVGWKSLLNYVGGSLIYIKANFADRLALLSSSWALANKGRQDATAARPGDKRAGVTLAEQANMTSAQKVPTTFDEMFWFNAAIMGFGRSHWMAEIVGCFDAVVVNAANALRLQEECEVLVLRLSRCDDPNNIDLNMFRSVMLASLRSLLPKTWTTNHEVAWSWLWEMVAKQLGRHMQQPAAWDKALRGMAAKLDESQRYEFRSATYARFFELSAAGQDFFKQSNTRLHFIAERVFQMAMDMYVRPGEMMDEISALGLRHVGYGIPSEMVAPFVTANIESLSRICDQDVPAMEAYRWSLGLIAKVLARTVNEGSTTVMKAINTNSRTALNRALASAPRGLRSQWLLQVRVGHQDISPLLWAIESGGLDVAGAVIGDLLTFRADRDRYYFGADDLFIRHPDIIHRLIKDAPDLLRTLLDGLTWRSRQTRNGLRRVNYYVKHLIVDDKDEPSPALKWISASGNVKLISHPVITLVSDTLWAGVARRQFILSRVGFIFNVLIFTLSQSILPRAVGGDDAKDVRWAILAGRAINYLMAVQRLIDHIREWRNAFVSGGIKRVARIPIPKYLLQTQNLLGLVLLALLMSMLGTEPMLHCIGDPEWPTDLCENARDLELWYSVLSVFATMILWGFFIDLSIFNTKLSAFVLVCGHVLSEVGRFFVALAFCLLMFGSAISCLETVHEEVQTLPRTVLTLFSATLGVYEKDYREMRDEPWVLAAIMVCILTTSLLLMNLLIAQLNTAYEFVYADMVGFARMKRASLIMKTVASCPKAKWDRFVTTLALDQPVEFDQGDLGIPGGLQVLEPASLHPVLTDMVKRFGGSTSEELPWPEEPEVKDRVEQLEDLLKTTLERIKETGGRGAASSRGGSSAHSRASEQASGHGSSFSSAAGKDLRRSSANSNGSVGSQAYMRSASEKSGELTPRSLASSG